MKSKYAILAFASTSIFLYAFFIGILLYYDPLKIFHLPFIYKEFIQGNMRQQAAGIINNWKFDSIILGSSVLENTSSKEASKYLEGNFVNISLSGSDFFERKIILDYALKTKNIKTILYSLDYSGLVDSRRGLKNYPLESFEFLYDSNPFNDFRAYINDRYLKCIFTLENVDTCYGRKTDFDRPNAWYKSKSHSVRFGGLNNWLKAENNNQIKSVFKKIVSNTKNIESGKIVSDDQVDRKILDSQKYLDETIIEFVSKYPKTTFVLIVPPHSRIQNSIDAQYNRPYFKRIKESIKYLVYKSSKHQNLEVYGWGDSLYPDEISNYKDLVHFSHNFNSTMLRYIRDKSGLLTIRNIESYLYIFTKKSLEYDVVAIGKKIESYLNRGIEETE